MIRHVHLILPLLLGHISVVQAQEPLPSPTLSDSGAIDLPDSYVQELTLYDRDGKPIDLDARDVPTEPQVGETSELLNQPQQKTKNKQSQAVPIAIGSEIGSWRILPNQDGRPFAATGAFVDDVRPVGEFIVLTIQCEAVTNVMVNFRAVDLTSVHSVWFGTSALSPTYSAYNGNVDGADGRDLIGKMVELEAVKDGRILAEFASSPTAPVYSTFEITGIRAVADFMKSSCAVAK